MFATVTKQPYLPEPGQRLPLVHSEGAMALGENIVISAIWAGEGSADGSRYIAHALTLDEGTMLDYPLYVVLTLECAYGDDVWVVSREQEFYGIVAATQHYASISGSE